MLIIQLKKNIRFEKRIINNAFSNPYKTLDQLLSSLHVVQLKQRAQTGYDFNSEQFQKEFWKPFEKKIINDFTEMGPYWQILMLKEVQSKILTQGS